MKTPILVAVIVAAALFFFRQVYVDWHREPIRRDPDDHGPS